MTNTEAFTLHAHVSTSARDCDGGHGQDYITVPNDDERQEFADGQKRGYNNFADLTFKNRVLGNHVSFHSEFGVTVKVDAEGFTMSEATEEGYRAAEVRWCEDADCDPESGGQYDEYAEAMGY
jgi:hypothetical protein